MQVYIYGNYFPVVVLSPSSVSPTLLSVGMRMPTVMMMLSILISGDIKKCVP